MDARLRTEVVQLSIVAGTQRERAGNIGLREQSSIIPEGPGKGNLYVLVELTGDPVGKEDTSSELIEVATKEYFRVPGGITNGLRQAIRAANSQLHERNQESLPLWRRLGEAACAVLRGHDLYMGLAGGAVIYVARGERLRRFPSPVSPRHPFLLAEEQQPLPRLGIEQYLREVGLFHCHVESEDIILLASSALPELVSQHQLMKSAQEGLLGMKHTLTALASRSDLSAVLIRAEAEESEDAVQRTPIEARQRSIFSGVRVGGVGHAAAKVKKLPMRRMASGLGGIVTAVGALILGFLSGFVKRVPAFFSQVFSRRISEPRPQGSRGTSVSLAQGLRTMARRMLPEPETAPQHMEVSHAHRTRVLSGGKTVRSLPLIGVFAIMCIIALIAAGIVLQNRSQVAAFSRLLEEAQYEKQLALRSSTRAAISEHLEKAHGVVEQALEIRPADPAALAFQEEVRLALDDTNQVVRLQFSAQMPITGLENRPSCVLLHDEDVYVLDDGTQELYGYVLDEHSGFQERPGGPVLLGRQDRPGGTAIDKLNDFVWMDVGGSRQTSSLLLLVNDGSILGFDGLQGFALVSVAESQLWSEPRLIGGYSGNLYVLDAEQDRILKYLPTGDSYDSAPMDYFQAETTVELGSAVDMAIDGYIYVLLADGGILRFAGGRDEPFSVSGLDEDRLDRPSAIFTSPQTDYIYLADAGNRRVLQLDKEGALVRQFRPAWGNTQAFQELRDIFVQEGRGQLLALDSGQLFLAPIPVPTKDE